MPVPSREDVVGIVAPYVERRGLDLEEVRVAPAGKRSMISVVVDADSRPDIDALATLSREISEVLDAANTFGQAPYVLEVTSPGVDRPLTAPRHWRRARGRKVQMTVGGKSLRGRVGALIPELDPHSVEIVVPGKPGPQVRVVALAEIGKAVVQVEFSEPDPREIQLAQGVQGAGGAGGGHKERNK
ncbi:ribosome maturation factor RimP [Hoyosella subflava]|uniref:Ribosome maturation factor RimP n=1 Tax=Hoyosella subflava (strain DSM 45089 / JCM 17490 / NBRC 109087 / DQS3-9A1) TaxID=443218 RepID=F6EJP4_HOYSD|nr:ribosome maturation factor RimP [Hoyosella subflava]AEF40069.1 Ribosome maturation factor rimP [Hoyosella subflava DQS3-9A1]